MFVSKPDIRRAGVYQDTVQRNVTAVVILHQVDDQWAYFAKVSKFLTLLVSLPISVATAREGG